MEGQGEKGEGRPTSHFNPPSEETGVPAPTEVPYHLSVLSVSDPNRHLIVTRQ